AGRVRHLGLLPRVRGCRDERRIDESRRSGPLTARGHRARDPRIREPPPAPTTVRADEFFTPGHRDVSPPPAEYPSASAGPAGVAGQSSCSLTFMSSRGSDVGVSPLLYPPEESLSVGVLGVAVSVSPVGSVDPVGPAVLLGPVDSPGPDMALGPIDS